MCWTPHQRLTWPKRLSQMWQLLGLATDRLTYSQAWQTWQQKAGVTVPSWGCEGSLLATSILVCSLTGNPVSYESTSKSRTSAARKEMLTREDCDNLIRLINQICPFFAPFFITPIGLPILNPDPDPTTLTFYFQTMHLYWKATPGWLMTTPPVFDTTVQEVHS